MLSDQFSMCPINDLKGVDMNKMNYRKEDMGRFDTANAYKGINHALVTAMFMLVVSLPMLTYFVMTAA